MRKLVFGFLTLLVVAANAQPIFTYGNKAVSKDEFVRAFNKNPNPVEDRKKALKEYLDLYINFKLKVQAAFDAKLDANPNQQFELDNFKKQIAENIINEEAKVAELVKEAFQRCQKDIHLTQVFIEVPAQGDTLEAYKKIQAAYKALKAGNEFSKVVQEFSNDAASKETGGDMGFVTAFTLPYEFENVVYSLKENSFSSPLKSNIGYHIFKNVSERKAWGTRRVAQILFALPPGATDWQRNTAIKNADSVYNLLQKGASFEDMVKTFSNDINSVNNNGELTEFGIGEYNTAFEQAAFALINKGDISKPVETNYGYHIIKLLEAKPVAANVNDAVYNAWLKDKVLRDDRLVQAKKILNAKHLALIHYKPTAYSPTELWKYTDSTMQNKKTDALKVNDKTVLFSFSKQTIKAADWAKFVKAMRAMPTEMSRKSYPELMTEYIKITGDEYYKNHLEEYSPAYNQQVKEFKEANLLFGVMDKNVWSKANTDTAGLQDYYSKYKSKYQWQPSANALIITCATREVAEDLQQKLKADINNWRRITEGYGTQVTADSGRYELGQLPVVDRTIFTEGNTTAPVKNQTESTYTFNYILKMYNQNQQRSFEDARGMIISDYQQVLEDKWIAQLKKKYTVKVNYPVFASIK